MYSPSCEMTSDSSGIQNCSTVDLVSKPESLSESVESASYRDKQTVLACSLCFALTFCTHEVSLHCDVVSRSPDISSRVRQ
jgi:hypothetical protein